MKLELPSSGPQDPVKQVCQSILDSRAGKGRRGDTGAQPVSELLLTGDPDSKSKVDSEQGRTRH